MKKLYVILIALIMACISSCTSASKENVSEKAEKQAVYELDSLSLSDTTNHPLISYPAATKEEMLNDLEIVSPAIIKEYIRLEKTEGSLVYYCSDRMLENTCNNVSVCISTEEVKRAVENLVLRVQETNEGNESEIREDISDFHIEIYPKMKVELKYDGNDFATIYQPENVDRVFDGESDMNWDWIIKPLKVGKLQLTLIVSAYDKKNDQWVSVDIPPKIFDISVKVDPRGYLAKLWGFLENNPEWIFAQLIFPIIGFYTGRRKKRKEAKSLDT